MTRNTIDDPIIRALSRPFSGMEREGEPIEGHYMLRLVDGGPLMPARIFRACPLDPDFGYPLDRPRPLLAEIDGRPAKVMRVWTWGTPISPGEFEYLRAAAAHERRHAPAMPRANPRDKIDHGTMTPLF